MLRTWPQFLVRHQPRIGYLAEEIYPPSKKFIYSVKRAIQCRVNAVVDWICEKRESVFKKNRPAEHLKNEAILKPLFLFIETWPNIMINFGIRDTFFEGANCYVCVCVCMCVFRHFQGCTLLCMCACVCVYVCVCMFVRVRVCACIYEYVCM